MTRNEKLLWVIRLLFVVLWVYAATGKLQEPDLFRGQLQRQPLPASITRQLVWGLPTMELLATGLLLFHRTRGWGVFLSLLLMLLFTGYIGLVLLGAWDKVPCACGGLIGSLGWKAHLLFNLVFVALGTVGLLLLKNQNRGSSSG